MALLQQRGVDVVMRLHQRRPVDFRRGRRLGQEDQLVVWQKPKRPDWLEEGVYAELPATLTVRQVRLRGCPYYKRHLGRRATDCEEGEREHGTGILEVVWQSKRQSGVITGESDSFEVRFSTSGGFRALLAGERTCRPCARLLKRSDDSDGGGHPPSARK
jgi:hypothetical protein